MIIQKIVELFAPADCLGCGLRGDFLCQACLSNIAIKPKACCVCRKYNNTGLTCDSCKGVTSLTSLTVAADYDGAVRLAVLALKNNRARSVASQLGDVLTKALDDDNGRFDLVTWVPVSPARRRERGYNQAELLGRRVARRLGLPTAPTLGRTTSLHQTGAARAQRLAQVAGAFYATQRLDGRRVLLVDDVVTTAATMEECARVLLAAGAAEVHGTAVARSQN
jgi:ComF family protein